jgi:hypothetical protein
MIAGGNWWRVNEIVMRHLTSKTDARYRSRDNTVWRSVFAISKREPGLYA